MQKAIRFLWLVLLLVVPAVTQSVEGSLSVQVGGDTITGWRLPKHLPTPQGCWGDCTVSDELQHLWVEELGNPFGSLPSYSKAPFGHLHLEQIWYWVEGGWYDSTSAKGWGHVGSARAIFVHDGDVVAAVSLPPTAWLFVSGLLSLAGLVRWRRVDRA